MRVRMALDERLEDDAEARIVVVGDLDDGPGVDLFEEHPLIHNVVAVVFSNPFNPRRMLRHAFIDRELRGRNWTARFDDCIDGIRDRPLLLDRILLAPAMYWGPFRTARIEHDAFEAQIGRRASGRMRDASDHRPQGVTLELG